MEIFNNRELATIFWIIITIISITIISIKKETNISLFPLIKAFTHKKILIPFGFMISYIFLMIYLLYIINLWNTTQLKNTFLWFFSFGILTFFNTSKIIEDDSYFKNVIFNNLKLLAVLEFFINVYSFSLITEVILIFLLLTINILFYFAKKEEKHHKIKIFLECCLIFLGFIILIYAFSMMIINPEKIFNKSTVLDFSMPIILTLCYLPFVFLLLLYMTYEKAFLNLHIFIEKRYLQILAKIYTCIIFNMRRNLIERWFEHIKIIKIESYKDLILSIKHVLRTYKTEKNPKEISSNLGWSPYQAKYFLSAKNIKTFPYELQKNGKWWTTSKVQNPYNKQPIDYISYYLDGNKDVVTTLTLNIYIKADQDNFLFKKNVYRGK